MPVLIVVFLAAVFAGCGTPSPLAADEVRAARARAAGPPRASAPRGAERRDAPSAASPVPASSRQLVLVVTDAWTATGGQMQRYARRDGAWETVGDAVPTVVGRGGLGWGRGLHTGAEALRNDPSKREGDGRAPAGAFRLTAAFGYAQSERTGLPYIPTDADTECVDDPVSGAYNTVVERPGRPSRQRPTPPRVDWNSHEEMRRSDHIYRIGAVVAHNGPGVAASLLPAARGAAPVPGGGSCIFLHVWRTPTTATSGCTAMPDQALATTLAWLDAAADPVLVQLPRAAYERLAAAWALP